MKSLLLILLFGTAFASQYCVYDQCITTKYPITFMYKNETLWFNGVEYEGYAFLDDNLIYIHDKHYEPANEFIKWHELLHFKYGQSHTDEFRKDERSMLKTILTDENKKYDNYKYVFSEDVQNKTDFQLFEQAGLTETMPNGAVMLKPNSMVRVV